MAILIVDDNAINLMLLDALATSASELPTACIGEPVEALQWCAANVPELVLVDYRMPNLSGSQFIALFRRMPGMADIPIVMITTENDRAVRQEALAAGATDFIAKPVDAVEFRLRVRNLLALSQARALLADRARLLQHEVAAALQDLAERERELVMRLARAAEFRDPETGAHIQRMARYSELIARALGMPPAYQQRLLAAAPLHDVGKLATPDHILLKAGPLTADEMAQMRRHTEHGAHILAGSAAPVIQLAEDIARAHHEKFDGSGYPQGLAGAAIPLAARIVAVADVFDALTSVRPYKAAWPMEQARAFIEQHSGSHFCPDCASAFLASWDEVLAIHATHQDAAAPAY